MNPTVCKEEVLQELRLTLQMFSPSFPLFTALEIVCTLLFSEA